MPWWQASWPQSIFERKCYKYQELFLIHPSQNTRLLGRREKCQTHIKFWTSKPVVTYKMKIICHTKGGVGSTPGRPVGPNSGGGHSTTPTWDPLVPRAKAPGTSSSPVVRSRSCTGVTGTYFCPSAFLALFAGETYTVAPLPFLLLLLLVGMVRK